jgi:hypothetical protein
MGQEGDDVMLDLALDLVDPRHIELGVLALFPDLFRRVLRHHAQFGQRVGGMRLDLEPDAEFGLGRPDRNHLFAGIAGDHGETVCELPLLLARIGKLRKRTILYGIPVA